MTILTITTKHGKEMYINGLEHAIRMFEIAGEDALPTLKLRIKEVNEEIEQLKLEEE